MYIEPNTVIRVLHNCPLDTTYEHTIYFASESAQINYFQSLTKYTFNDQSYQRVQRGRMRVQRKAEDLYDCNYLMFQNSSFGNKWFYAFITGVEYVNNITSEIAFEIDVMQTWWFDFTVKQCFVEREHSVTDVAGDNLVPEDVALGDYQTVEISDTNMFTAWDYIVIASFDENGDDASGASYHKVYSGLKYNFFETPLEVNAFLEDNAQKALDGVVTILQIPRFMHTDYSQDQQTIVWHNISAGSRPSSFGSYTPKNKKLLTYPYNFLYVTNYDGNSAVYQYEYFENNTPTFRMTAGLNANPSFVLVPRDYKFQTNQSGVQLNYDEKLTLSGLPHCAYNVDMFKAWLAQNAANLGVKALSTVASLVPVARFGKISALANKGKHFAQPTKADKAAAIAGGYSAGSNIADVVCQGYEAWIKPPQANGEQGSVTNVNIGLFDFGFYKKQIMPQFARIIDDYFNMYGYATRRVKVPNINSRPHWNYVKTIGAVITGSVPCDDMDAICAIYDKGITFWKSGAEVGNYSLDNTPS